VAPAKVNLLLGVSTQVVEGRHRLDTVLSTIDLADRLLFTFDAKSARRVTLRLDTALGIDSLELPIEQNLVYRAVEALERSSGRRLEGHLDIVIEKHLPIEAGLAGGSSDAAATLGALATLWGLEPLEAPLLAAAHQLGSDVAFFLHGGCALMGGAGEMLVRRLPMPSLDLVLVKPAQGISTAAAYAAFDNDPQPAVEAARLVELLEAKAAAPQLASALANNLYPAAQSLLPEVGELIDELRAAPQVHAALLTGSGSTVYGVCKSAKAAAALAQHFIHQGHWAQPCKTR
jgi:4-diphosphocytidyl-2-C-methyl-D-erythritol kinase